MNWLEIIGTALLFAAQLGLAVYASPIKPEMNSRFLFPALLWAAYSTAVVVIGWLLVRTFFLNGGF